MNISQPIHTETNNCQDCYKCIRECPVKAIKVESDSASIIKDLCIFCGKCVLICPVGAKKIRNDLDRVRLLLKQSRKVYVSLAPSFVPEFVDYGMEGLIVALQRLGFAGVSETALGAELYTRQAAEYLDQKESGVFISTACPSVVELIRKFYPELVPNLVPLLSPMLAHGQLLRRWLGDDIHVVFIGPCVAKKTESDEFNDIIDAALTFSDLRRWLEAENIMPDSFSNSELSEAAFNPFKAGEGAIYPIDGGMVHALQAVTNQGDVFFMNISGVENIRHSLAGFDLVDREDKIFLELMACDGGCVCGPGNTIPSMAIIKNYYIRKYLKSKTGDSEANPEISKTGNIQINHCYLDSNLKQKEWLESDITDALRTVGKTHPEDELNCGGCGYNSCRNFAISMLNDMAERQMCVSYMRKVASDKASVLLQRMPYGVVLADENLRIIECNEPFARLLGEEACLAWDAKPGLSGGDLHKFLSFHNIFSNVLSSGIDFIDKDLSDKEHMFNLSVFSIQKHKIVCGIIHDLHHGEIIQEEVLKRVRKVVRENLETVQKVAFLLGENAARTEATLNAVVNSGPEKKMYE